MKDWEVFFSDRKGKAILLFTKVIEISNTHVEIKHAVVIFDGVAFFEHKLDFQIDGLSDFQIGLQWDTVIFVLVHVEIPWARLFLVALKFLRVEDPISRCSLPIFHF